MRRTKIVVVTSAGLLDETAEQLSSINPSCEIISVIGDFEEIIRVVSDADALINCPRNLFSAEIINKAPNLRWIHCGGAGIEEFLIPELVNCPIVLTNGKIVQGPGVSDHAIGLLLCLTRRLNLVVQGQKVATDNRPVELRGKNAAVFGIGGIGTLIVEKLRAFGVLVTGVDVEYVPLSCGMDDVYGPERFQDEIENFDILMCAAPLTKSTSKFFDAKLLEKIKEGSYFINVSRGELVDLDGLMQANVGNRLGGIGLDVSDPEPLPKDHPLRKMNNVIISPHIAGLSDYNRQRSLVLLQENISRFVEDKQLINVVDKGRGY